MARHRQYPLDLVITQGLVDGADDKVQRPGGFVTFDNCYYDKDGSIVKRPAFDSAIPADPNSTALSGTPKRLAKWMDGIVLMTHQELYDYSVDEDVIINRGSIPEWDYPDRTEVYRDVQDTSGTCCVQVVNGFRIYLWILDGTTGVSNWPSGDVLAQVFTSDGRRVLFAVLGSGSRCRLTVTGNTAVAWWLDDSGGAPWDIKYAGLNCASTPTAWGAVQTQETTVSAAGMWDVDFHTDGTHVYCFYDNAGNLKVQRLDASLSPTHNQSYAENIDVALNIYTDGTKVCVGYCYAVTPVTKARMFAHADLTLNWGPTNLVTNKVMNINWIFSGTANLYLWSLSMYAMGSLVSTKVMHGTFNSSTGSINTVDPSGTWHLNWASRLFMDNNRIYGVVTHGKTFSYAGSTFATSSTDAAFTLVEVDPDVSSAHMVRPVAQLVGNGLARNIEFRSALARGCLGDVVSTGTGYLVALPELFRMDGTNNDNVEGAYFDAGVVGYEIRSDNYASHEPAELDGLLYMTGGLTSIYDGSDVTEHGFAWAPEILSDTPTAGSNNWSYLATYVWEDAQGNLHESAPGKPYAVSSATNPVTLKIENLSLTHKHRPLYSPPQGRRIAIRLYRTLHNGSVYYLVQDGDNDCELESTTFSDTNADAAISDNEVLYSQGGIVTPRDLYASEHNTTWDNRVVLTQGGTAVMTTQAGGDRAPYVPDGATHTISSYAGGNLTAAAELDDSLVLFKKRGIHIVNGVGPSAQGVPAINPPRKASADTGCIDSRSVISCDKGIAFQSERGMYLLPRGFGNVQWIGKQCQDVLATYPYAFAGLVVPERSHAVWIVNDDLSTVASSKLLIWDYDRNVWMTWTTPNSSGAVGDLISGVLLDDTLYFMCDRKYLFAEDRTGAFIGDNNATGGFNPVTIETTNIRPANYTTGYARVYSLKVLGELLESDGAVLQLYVYTDDATSSPDSKSWTITGSVGDRFMREYVLPWQKVNSVRIQLEDATAAVAGRGLGIRLNSMTLQIVPRTKAGFPVPIGWRGDAPGGGGGG